MAAIDPDKLSEAMLIGIAPAMCADPRRTARGSEPDACWGKATKKSVGCDEHELYRPEVEEVIEKMEPGQKAREVMQALVAPQGDEKGPRASEVEKRKKRKCHSWFHRRKGRPKT